MSLLQKAEEFKARTTSPFLQRDGKDLNQLLSTIEDIYHIKDLDTLLEHILWEARHFVNADAGTLYLTSGDKLYFSYVQNDTLIPQGSNQNKYLGGDLSLSIDTRSIAGYVAMTGESLLIDDVYDIRSSVSFSFNPDFDKKTSYKTQSILVVPLTTRDDLILGVLQLINAKDNGGRVVPFSMQDRLYISQFAQSAANAIEKAKLSREMVLRLVEMAELRDPYETGPHVKRVGAFSVELYDAWARKHGVPEKELLDMKDLLRTASILHDLGKVAISDMILKKPGSLTLDERNQIKMHTIYGARLFLRSNSAWDRMAGDVTLNHHEKWDGTGYPGKIADINADKPVFGPGKRGKEIPFAARVVAIADTFDALVSERSYKDIWDEDTAFRYLKDQSGRAFDPELVELFIGISETVRAIQGRYVDPHHVAFPFDDLHEMHELPMVSASAG
ncbi:MAG: GAF and HD-GYP domain-containing protein [Clostridia bacterium]|jgi:HD-GYP domain-containing protein (c-di-GMP phosphodiesterase class II)